MAQALLGRHDQRVQVLTGFLAELADRLLQGRAGKLVEMHLVSLNGLLAQLRDDVPQSVLVGLRLRPDSLQHGTYLIEQVLAGSTEGGLRVLRKGGAEPGCDLLSFGFPCSANLCALRLDELGDPPGRRLLLG